MRRKLYGNTISPACEVCAFLRTETPCCAAGKGSCLCIIIAAASNTTLSGGFRPARRAPASSMRTTSGSTEWPLTGMENFSCPAGQNLTKNQAAGT